jgi:hypothetical protein
MRIRIFSIFIFVCTQTVFASLTANVFPGVSFAPLSASQSTITPTVSVDSLNLADYSSVRFTGTLTYAVTDLALNFSAVSEGGVRLWIDDFLIIDSGGLHNETSAFRLSIQTIPVTANVTVAFRLEYSRWSTKSSVPNLSLYWEGITTPHSIIPASAFSPDSPVEQMMMASLRDKLAAPQVPWQTYYRRSTVAHTLAPTGLVVNAAIVDTVSASILNDVFVQRGGSSYISRAGLHSKNGSDYTQFSLWEWNQHSCNISIETTVTESSQLQFLATANGADCNRFYLLITSIFFDERVGFPLNKTGVDGFTVDIPGFPTVSVSPAGAVPMPLNGSLAPSVPYFALSLGATVEGQPAVVGYCAAPGSSSPMTCPSVALMIDNIAAARIRASSEFIIYEDLADAYEGIASSILWNTIYAVQEGVVAIVSRNPNWAGNSEFVADYVLFEWDSYFIAIQASAQDGMLRDIGISTLVQVTLARTPRGFVPNWKSGAHSSYDRTENQVGAFIALRIVNMLPPETKSWIANLLVPVFISWHQWVWTSRIARGGVFDGSPLMIIGSDPSLPHDNGDGTMQGARYESMDNSACYDAPPISFNSSTHQIMQYDVSPTALFLSDTEALMTLAAEAGRTDILPVLESHFNATALALNTYLWENDLQTYANRLFNGTFNPRLSPTSFYPLLSGVVSDANAISLAKLLVSPEGFCVNSSHTPGSDNFPTGVLTRWNSRSTGHSVGCVTSSCSDNVLLYGRADFEGIEASLPLYNESNPPPTNALALNFYTTSNNITALSTEPPNATFTFVRQEGWCFLTGSVPSGDEFKDWPVNNLTLWSIMSESSVDYRTCGTLSCVNGAISAGYAQVGDSLCTVFDASTPITLPCIVPVPSIARADSSFFDQNYWRGRAWAPQYFLVYFALKRYEHIPEINGALADLIDLGRKVMLSEWLSFGHVVENLSGLTGFSQDSGNADPFYCWGGCFAMPAILESQPAKSL